MRRKVFTTIIAGVLLSSLSFGYSGGSGTAADPYQIATKADLLALAATTADYSKCFILTADIDLDPNLPGGQVFTTAIIAADTVAYDHSSFDGTAFTGTFDGDGHIIANLSINGSDQDYVGLFGYVNTGSQVKNLGVEEANIQGCHNVGGLVGHQNAGTITTCYATGHVTGTNSNVGGLVGSQYAGTITTCYATGTVSGSYSVGGLVGGNVEGTITECYATGTVSGGDCVGGLVGYNMGYNNGTIITCYATGTVSGGDGVGGLVGFNAEGGISNCYSIGSVSGSYEVGGLVGQNVGSINECYSTGSVSGGDCVGGLVGQNNGGFFGYGGIISNCYSMGIASGGSYVGGLVGYNNGGSLTACFWDMDTSGTTDGVGNVDPDPAGAMGKTTVLMQMLSTFTDVGWDFSTTDGDPADWMMLREGEDYPRLVWQSLIVGDIAGLYGVNMVDLKELSAHWLQTDCPAGCENADINADGTVDTQDLLLLADHWLEGV